jgi:hypothetical protein
MNRFLEKSEQQIFRGCICAIDGFLQTFSKPRKMDCDDFPQAYWSGHYMSYGLNVKAVQLLYPILWCRGTRKMSRSEGI